MSDEREILEGVVGFYADRVRCWRRVVFDLSLSFVHIYEELEAFESLSALVVRSLMLGVLDLQ